MPENYQPIDCGLYDQLESYAVKKETCLIEYFVDGGESTEVQSRFVDLYTRNKEEFAKLETGIEIRLDQIVRVNGVEITNSCRVDGS